MGKLNVDAELASASWWVRLRVVEELADEDEDGNEEAVRPPMASIWEPSDPFVTMADGWIGLQLSNESVFNDLVDDEAEDDEDEDDVDDEELIR